MGDKLALLNNAIEMIECRCGKVIKKSSIYESEPWGFICDENFVNQAICIETELSAHDLLKKRVSRPALCAASASISSPHSSLFSQVNA